MPFEGNTPCAQSKHAITVRENVLKETWLVPEAGLEPASLAAVDFESTASTNSATRARFGRLTPLARRRQSHLVWKSRPAGAYPNITPTSHKVMPGNSTKITTRIRSDSTKGATPA